MLLGIAGFAAGPQGRANELNWAAGGRTTTPQVVTLSLAKNFATTVPVGDSCCEHCGSDACTGECSACDDGCCDDCDLGCGRCLADCDGCPGLGLVGWAGLDTFRGLPDGPLAGNFGLVSGLNSGLRLPGIFGDLGLGWQTGASYGLYDLQGRVGFEPASSQEQFFVTTGFFRRATAELPVSGGLVYDWMINDNFGAFASEPFLGQWRGQLGYALGARHEVGWWGAFHDRRDQQAGLAFRGISQQNMYLRRHLNNGGDGWIYVGIPERNRLTGAGSLGEWIVGGALSVPLGNRLASYLNFAYMCPSAPAGAIATVEEYWQLGAGLAFYPGRAARSSTVAGRCWLPLMPVATNGTFMVDTNVVVQ